MQNDDLYLVVTAININQQVGGNLVTMLDAVTQTIRERIRLFAEVRVLTSQQRFNSYILTLIPIGIGALMFALEPILYGRVVYAWDLAVHPDWSCDRSDFGEYLDPQVGKD